MNLQTRINLLNHQHDSVEVGLTGSLEHLQFAEPNVNPTCIFVLIVNACLLLLKVHYIASTQTAILPTHFSQAILREKEAELRKIQTAISRESVEESEKERAKRRLKLLVERVELYIDRQKRLKRMSQASTHK